MTTFSDEVRETVSPHKFGGSRRAAAAWLVSLEGMADEESGDSESPTGWFARIGRTIVSTDSQGFVYCERYPSEDEARDVFARLDEDYFAWDNGIARGPNAVYGANVARCIDCGAPVYDPYGYGDWTHVDRSRDPGCWLNGGGR